MATPNYSYEKRQRELAKKRKNEEKLLKKKQPGPGDGPADQDHGGGKLAADGSPAEPGSNAPSP